METEKKGCVLAVRVRGSAGLRHQFESTLKQMGLTRRNQAMLFSDTPAIRGTLARLKDTLFWGEVTEEQLTLLFTSRSRQSKSKRLTDEDVKKRLKIENIQALAKRLSAGELNPAELKKRGLSIRFNLHSPKGGFRGSLKDSRGKGGELGFRTEYFRETLKRMI